MQASLLGTRSRLSYLFCAFAILVVVAFLLGRAVPRATMTTADNKTSEAGTKHSEPEFVPGEALVRYRSERLAQRKNVETLVSAEGRQLAIQLERFDGSDIVPGLRIALMVTCPTAHLLPHSGMSIAQ
jgi:hypothetical protein